MPPDATDRRPERRHRSRPLKLDKAGGKIAESRWNQLSDWHSDVHLRSTHHERFYVTAAQRSRSRNGS